MLQASPSTETPYSVDSDFVPTSPFDIPWHRDANCFGEGYDLFFPDSKLGVTVATRRADEWCTSCPVKKECLTSALEHRDTFGVWGGLTWKQRQRLLVAIDAGQMTLGEAVESVSGD